MFSKKIVLVTTILTLTKLSESVVKLTWPDNLNEIRVVCYYGSWAASRTGVGRFGPEDINPLLCTHLLYAFARITKDITLKPFDEDLDIKQGGYEKFTGLKYFNKKLITGISLGGWNEGSVRFASIAANSTKRQIFIKNCIKYLRQHNFDFLDFDWQFPHLKDRLNYSVLIKELREGFEIEALETGRFRLGLSITLPTLVDHVNRGYDIAALTKYVDCMHALTYNYHTEFEPLVYHHSQLYGVDHVENSDREVNANYTISFYLASGAEKQKLALGVSTYGQVYNLSDPNLTDIGSPAAGPGLKGQHTNQSGYLAYYEICRKIKDNRWTVKQPYPNAMGQYAYKDNQWVGFDDENIMRKKGEYVAENKLGGIMFWLLEYDDFNGYCGGKQFPLIKAAKEGLRTALTNTVEKVEDEKDSRITTSFDKHIEDVKWSSMGMIKDATPVNIPSEMISSGTNVINLLSAFSSNPGGISNNVPNTSSTKLSNDKSSKQVDIFEQNDKKHFEDDKILKQLGTFMEESGGIEGLRRFLNMFKTTTSELKPVIIYNESPQQDILDTPIMDNKQIRQLHKEESRADPPDGVFKPFETKEFKNGSRILNIIFNINFT